MKRRGITRTLLIRGPSTASIAGSNVRVASTETTGINMPPMPIERSERQRQEDHRQEPDRHGRARDDHRVAGVGHRLDERRLDVVSLAELVAEAEDHQQRVVDRDAEADQRDQELHDDRDVGDVRQRPDERERVEDRRDRDDERRQHGGQRPEDEEQDQRARRAPPISASRRTLEPPPEPLLASPSASRPVTSTLMPAGSPAAAAARIFAAPLFTSRPARPGRYTCRNVVCRSRDTYIELPVEKYELVSAPGLAFTTRAIAARTAGLLLTSAREEWKTTVLGDRTPAPNALNVRWLAS